MNDHKPKERRLVFRPMSLAVHGLSIATASSVLLWTIGGGNDTPLPPLASAATKSEKPDKNSPQGDAADSEPATGGRSHKEETKTVSLDYFSTPWAKVLIDLAEATNSELVVDRVPKGRFNRRDKAKYSRHEAVRIINKEIEPLGFRLIEKGDFLIVLDLPKIRAQYPPAVLPPRQPAEQPTASMAPTQARVQSITRQGDAAAQDSKSETSTPAASATGKSNGRPVRQVSHEESKEGEPGAIPAELGDDRLANLSQVIFRPRNRSVKDLSRQMFRTFKPRAQIIEAGRNQLPAFRITTSKSPDDQAAAQRIESAVTIAIDEASEELVIDATPRDADAAVKLFRILDRPIDGDDQVKIAASSTYVCQIAHQLPAEIERLRAAKQRGPATLPATQQLAWVADAEPRTVAQVDDPMDLPGARPNVPIGIGDQLGNLKGEVNIEVIDDFGALILRGNEKDVEQVMRVIRELEKLSEATAPRVHLLYLKHVDAESIAELLTTVYERLTKFPGRATQPRQSAAILPITKPNSLMIIAPEADLNAILDLAEELDRPVDPLTEFQVFGLKSAIATQVEEMINQFYAERKNLGAKVLVISDMRSNSLIVRAQARDLEEISALIRRIDRDEAGATQKVKFFPLKNALATDLAAVMNSAIQSVLAAPSSGGGGGGGQGGQGPVGLNTGQVGEQFRISKSAMMNLTIVDANGNREVSSGILADIRITPDSRVNTLMVTASEQSMSLIEELIKQLDRPTTVVSEIKVFTLANADAEMMVQQLNALFNNQPQGQGAGAANQQRQQLGIALEGAADSSSSLVPLKFSVDKRTNSVIAVGSKDALGVVEAILLRLDESDLRARQNVVIRLQNSQATMIAQSVQTFYQTQRDIAQQANPDLVSSVEQLEKEVVVVPDATNNSLLLSATPRYFKNIENMILKLDAVPRQVIIQAMLIEVELNNTDEFGIELGFQDPLQFLRSTKDAPITYQTTSTVNTNTTVANNIIVSQSGSPGFNFNNPSVPLGNNLGTPDTNVVASQALTNFNLGRVNSTLGFGGLVLSAGSDAVNVLIRALSAHHKITVLSRPQIRALDNQQAEIFSGQQVPVINGFTSSGTTGTNTPTVQQQQVGILLQVMPRITADGNVVMLLAAQRSQYRQQGVPLSTDITGKTVSSPILDKSSLNTTISVPTGNTVVIGGLIQTYDELTTNKAPFLADIPLLGSLFRYDSRTTRRTELLMFLTPRIIRGGLEEEAIKEVELGRMHIIESEVEDLHGPLLALPCPDDVFSNPNSSPYPLGNPSPANVPTLDPQPAGPPPTPGIDPNLPPAPAPRPDPTTTKSMIRDPDFSPAAARLKYTEEDGKASGVQQAKLESGGTASATTPKAKKPKKKTTTTTAADEDAAPAGNKSTTETR